MIDKLITALRTKDLTAKEIAEVIWLAVKMQQAVPKFPSIPLENQVPQSKKEIPQTIPSKSIPSDSLSKPEPSNSKNEPSPSTQKDTSQSAGVYTQHDATPSVSFKVPDALSLPEPLNLARAIRSLLRQVPSNTALTVLDETPTIQKIAEEQIWIPVLKPVLEPWLEVALVVDESESMLIWQHTIVEIQQILENYGVFRDIRTWGLVVEDRTKIKIRPGTGVTRGDRGFRSTKELIDPNGRRLILIVSDCIASFWHNGAILDALKIWSESGLAVILQMLPQHMWQRTALGLQTPVLFSALEVGVFNQKLRVKQVSAWDDTDIDTGIKVPVVTLEVENLYNWAQMITGKGGTWIPGFVFDLQAVVNDDFDNERSSVQLSAQQRVQRFRVTASPIARKLAILLAAAPVICLPVMRIIQAQMLSQSRQIHVAEVFLGGLLKPLSKIERQTKADSVEYDFMPGVREILLESIPSKDSLDVISKVSEYIAYRLGLSLQEFAAVLQNFAPGKDDGVASQVRPFARVTAQVLKRMGGEYARFAEQLEQQLSNESIPKSKRKTKGNYDFERNLAVVIGINEYSNGIPPLTTPVADAEKLANVLQQTYKYQVKILLNSQATLSELNALLADFKNKKFPVGNTTVEVKESDCILFYFAGHGIVPTDGLEDDSLYRGYLIPTDAKTETLLQTQDLLLPMQDLHDALIELPCRHMLVILDGCFTGAFRSSSYRNAMPARKVYKERYDRFIRARAWQVITSAAYDQKALDFLGFFGKRESDLTQEHSPFASALFEALEGHADTTLKRGDGIITATEIYSYVRDKVEQITDDRNAHQTPSLFPLQKHDKGEFIFLLPHFDRENLEDAPALKPGNNPYRGLKSYEEQHSSLFFGRNELINQLYTHISERRNQLTVVLGVSGSGKSSLVKAGLIPCLRTHHEQEFYILPTIRPTRSPFGALAEAVLRNAYTTEAENYTTEAEKQKKISFLKEKLKEAPSQFINLIEQYNQVRANTKFLLVVDQFEELLTMCLTQKTRESFLNFLTQALEADPRLYIVLTLRSDFESRFTDSPLKSYWDTARFQVKAMKSHELRQAIERPAIEKMLDFEPPTLVDRLIDDVGQMPGTLSLLSFTLSELYIKCVAQERRTLTQEDYDALGGVIGSLRQRATEECDKFDSAHQATLRRVMLRMVAIEDGQLARRRVPLWELKYPTEAENQRVEKILDHFERVRLIVRGKDIGGEPYVEPVHDALVREWDKLEKWQRQEYENLMLQQRLTFAARDWDKHHRDNGYLWVNDPRLSRLEKLLESKDGDWLNQLEIEFVQSSIHRKKNELEKDKKQRQKF
ncbi:hypothetical protein WA1_15290 [Scytonema hofmannii PCC 7110]|uniref:Uncharacterized protein n=1 Tax=Scytonema hofmannii PCC 7110 TaxID=128403 RepID=A0A139XDH4_9CYAN|nr:SAV_2336 N-terminal domain-related protein [Scytonema hofmannii]KYC42703.1 hypothetical protein WA1_15290 [Scytonema hofmannii PCC 7110]